MPPQLPTALHDAAQRGDLPRAEELLASAEGMQMLNAQDAAGNTPLHFAARQPPQDLKSHERQKVLELLLAHGAELDVVDCYGATPIHLAAASGNPGGRACEALADAGCRLDLQDVNFGNTPLHYGALMCQDKPMFHLLQFSDGRLRETAKVGIGIRNKEGQSVLQVAEAKKTDWKPTVKVIKSFERLVRLEARAKGA